jgi:hypothetical protein
MGTYTTEETEKQTVSTANESKTTSGKAGTWQGWRKMGLYALHHHASQHINIDAPAVNGS